MQLFTQYHDQLADLKRHALQRLTTLLVERFDAKPFMALEYEFYLPAPEAEKYPQAVLHLVNQALDAAGIAALPAEEERGPMQFEVALPYTDNLAQLADAGIRLPRIISDAALKHGAKADFSPKPYIEHYGSGLHIHLHLEDSHGRNLFQRDETGHYSAALLWSVAGMLELLPESMLLFAPYPHSYPRFHNARQNAPTTISWGPNNRTVALRLPNKPTDAKHIEHRVSGSDADPELAMIAILAGALYGLQMQEYPEEPIHGDAANAQYDCALIPTYNEAVEHYQKSDRLPPLLGDALYGEVMRRLLMPASF